MNLFLIIYTATGAIGGTIGPLPNGMEACLSERQRIVDSIAVVLDVKPMPDKMRDEFSRVVFSCEYRSERPALGSEGE